MDILKHGAGVEVIAPTRLREKVLDMLKKYPELHELN